MTLFNASGMSATAPGTTASVAESVSALNSELMLSTFNPGAIPVAVLAIMLAVFEWRGRRWIIRANDEWRGQQRSDLQRRRSERILQVFAVVTVVAAVWVLTYDFG